MSKRNGGKKRSKMKAERRRVKIDRMLEQMEAFRLTGKKPHKPKR